jgi:hypothetical protein
VLIRDDVEEQAVTPLKPLRNADIDAQPMLDQDHRLMCKAMRNQARKDGTEFTMMDFARVCLRATAVDYAGAEGYARVAADRAHQHAALLFVYEALKACDHAIIKEWPEFDMMLQQLEDLDSLGLPV